ncbi:MAG: glycosyltransferase [Planctomycetota bacterium]
MTLSVAIDLSCAATSPRTGVERYALELARALAARPGVRPILLSPVPIEDAGDLGAPILGVEHETASPLARALWRRSRLPELARSQGAQLLHVPVSAAPSRPGLPVVRTVHDLGRLESSEAGPLARWRARRVLAQPLPTVFPSVATRDDWRGAFGTARAPQAIIAHGLDAEVLAAAERHEVRAGGRAALVLGTLRERRRPGLVARLARSGALGGPVVWAGPGSHPDGRSGENLSLLGPVSEERRLALLGSARLLLVPSAREGFCLPALEAMAMGRPVVCADLPALREFGEGVFVFTDLEREDAVRAAVAEAQDAVAMAPRLAEGRRRARAFTWDRAAEAHETFYRQVLAATETRKTATA